MRKYYVHEYRRAFHPQAPAWVNDVPAFRALRHGLDLRRPITLITGENGVGKSTLLEGIAVSCGFNARGGAYGEAVTGRGNPLRHAATLLRGPLPMNGHFLRAEAHYEVSSEFNLTYDTDLYALSHGESVLRIVQDSFHGAGLFLLDEPESGVDIENISVIAEGLRIILEKDQPISKRKRSAIIITHTGFILDYIKADIAFVIMNGHVLGCGAPGEIFEEIRRDGYNKCSSCFAEKFCEENKGAL